MGSVVSWVLNLFYFSLSWFYSYEQVITSIRLLTESPISEINQVTLLFE